MVGRPNEGRWHQEVDDFGAQRSRLPAQICCFAKECQDEVRRRAVSLEPEAEEVAAFYGSMLHSTVNVENPTFNKNFFIDFTEYLDKTGHGKDRDGKTVKIKSFEKCDFKPIYEYFDSERQRKKGLSKAEKAAIKAEKDKVEAPFLYCLWDGRKQKVGNFRVEPPGLFRGRGEHPKTGRVKKRVWPEQITINIGKEAMVPVPPKDTIGKRSSTTTKAHGLQCGRRTSMAHTSMSCSRQTQTSKGRATIKSLRKRESSR
ncbi:hypothetical protein MRB53_037064 [Persea americana]|nr:hypothetical protein MRB53_037064 [Persea americana]